MYPGYNSALRPRSIVPSCKTPGQSDRVFRDEQEFSKHVDTCILRGDAAALASLLSLRSLSKLTLSACKNGPLSAFKTLLEAIDRVESPPDPFRVGELVLERTHLDGHECALLLQLVDRMSLTSLRLMNCTFDANFELPEGLRLPLLENLDLDGTRNAFPLLQKILELSQPSKLRFCMDLGFTVDQHSSIARALENQPKLRQLKLQLPRVDSIALASYAQSLGQITVDDLDLSNNRLDPKVCDTLQTSLRGKATPSRLSLSSCWKAGDSVDPESVAKLFGLDVVRLDFSYNTLPVAVVKSVLSTLGDHASLKYLTLHQTSIPSDAITALADALANNPTLESLVLPLVNDKNCALLVASMKTNQSLRHLSISSLEDGRRIFEPDEFLKKYPNYLALLECAAANQRQWSQDMPVRLENGMWQVLSALSRNSDPDRPAASVPLDIARYAASIALELHGNNAMTLARVTRVPYADRSSELIRIREEREGTRQNGLPPEDHDKH